jgi:hypothetical protein
MSDDHRSPEPVGIRIHVFEFTKTHLAALAARIDPQVVAIISGHSSRVGAAQRQVR